MIFLMGFLMFFIFIKKLCKLGHVITVNSNGRKFLKNPLFQTNCIAGFSCQ